MLDSESKTPDPLEFPGADDTSFQAPVLAGAGAGPGAAGADQSAPTTQPTTAPTKAPVLEAEAVKGTLTSTPSNTASPYTEPTDIAVYNRPIHAQSLGEKLANAVANHQFVATVPRDKWVPGMVIGYGITNSHAKAGDKPAKEVYEPNDDYELDYKTVRTSASENLSEEELVNRIKNFGMSNDYNVLFYNCTDWADDAVKHAGLQQQGTDPDA